MGIGRILLSLQHFLHTPNSLQLPLNHTPCHPHMHAHIHTGPQGCFVHCWNVHVEHCLQLHPICTMCSQITKSLHMHTGSTAFFPWLVHHYVPTIHLSINLWQYSALHLHPHTCSEAGCTAIFGCAHPSMFPIAWRTFHHNPALVAPFILWLEYLLCAHHTHFPIFQLLGTQQTQ